MVAGAHLFICAVFVLEADAPPPVREVVGIFEELKELASRLRVQGLTKILDGSGNNRMKEALVWMTENVDVWGREAGSFMALAMSRLARRKDANAVAITATDIQHRPAEIPLLAQPTDLPASKKRK